MGEFRFLTHDIAGIGGTFKSSPADFAVDEQPLYAFSGTGEHTLVRIEKTGIATFEAVRRIGRALGVREDDIGTAGLKDARATTRQWVSIPRVDVAAVEQLELRDVTVLEVTRHANKLRRGHLAGNAFVCVLRNVDPAGEQRARDVLARLVELGAPNHFGDQRFGSRADTHRLGRHLVRGDAEGLIRELLGGDDDDPDAREARAAFEAGDLATAQERMPMRRNQERRLLRTLIEAGDRDNRWTVAVKQLPNKLKKLYVSAYQSWLFNSLLDARLPDLITLRTGDIAWLHRNGAAFEVTDAATEQPRADAFEISASGPLFGTKTLLATGEPGRDEQALLAAEQLTPDSFRIAGGLSQPGARRPYRFALRDAALEWGVPAANEDAGDRAGAVHCTVRFALSAGCYATNVLGELVKGDQPPLVPEA
ncbi:MAG: tRNA pseudouridine(13) synthase TruD [Planctomycetota bacterium]